MKTRDRSRVIIFFFLFLVLRLQFCVPASRHCKLHVCSSYSPLFHNILRFADLRLSSLRTRRYSNNPNFLFLLFCFLFHSFISLYPLPLYIYFDFGAFPTRCYNHAPIRGRKLAWGAKVTVVIRSFTK